MSQSKLKKRSTGTVIGWVWLMNVETSLEIGVDKFRGKMHSADTVGQPSASVLKVPMLTQHSKTKILSVSQSVLKAQSPWSSGYFKLQQPVILLVSKPRLLTVQQILKYCGCWKLLMQNTLLGHVIALPKCFTSCLTVMLWKTMISVLVAMKYHTVSQIILDPFF